MQSLSHSSYEKMNKICQLMSLFLQTQSNSSLSRNLKMNQKRFVIEKQLQRQFRTLKNNIQKIVQNGESLQNQNKVLKRMITRSNSSYSSYSNQISSVSLSNILNQQFTKYPTSTKKIINSNYSTVFTNHAHQPNSYQQNNPYQKNNMKLLSSSSNQFEKLKKQVVGLTQNLKSMTKAYQKYELDSTNDYQNKDIFLNQSSLLHYDNKHLTDESTKNEQIDLEHLLCDQELSFEDLPLQQKSISQMNNDQIMVDSLIAKGIQFRESRTMRSKQYKSLSNTIQKYRQQFQNRHNVSCLQKQSISKYR